MPVFFCRWPDGSFSIVEAISDDDAVQALDEINNAAGLRLVEVEDFRLLMDFELNSDGSFTLRKVGDYIEEIFWGMYPKLCAVQGRDEAAIRRAVAEERRRVKSHKAPPAKTELGKEIQAKMDLPASLADEAVTQHAKKTLRKFRPRGKPQ